MEVRRLLPDAPAVYARPDRLLYNRNGMLVAQAFDAERLELRGEPQPVAAGPAAANAALGGRFSVSDNGTLVVQDPHEFDYQLTWFTAPARGRHAQIVFRVAAPQLPRLSPTAGGSSSSDSIGGRSSGSGRGAARSIALRGLRPACVLVAGQPRVICNSTRQRSGHLPASAGRR
jgi:hypothetical protein